MTGTKNHTTHNGVEKPTESAFRAILRTCGLFRHAMEPYFARFGISGSQWGVLRVLHRAQADGLPGLRLTDVSERLLIRPPSVTGVVDRLQRLELVARSTLPSDQRARCISLTPTGRHLVERILESHGAQIDAVLAGLSLSEQRELHRLLDRLALHLETIVERGESNGIG